MELFCQRHTCQKFLLDVSDKCKFSSLNVRCGCGARYRVASVGGLHTIQHVEADSLSEAALIEIENDPNLRPEDKVVRFNRLSLRASRARDSYNTAYGTLIHKAKNKETEWHKRATKEVVEARKYKTSVGGVELINRMAVAVTASGQPLFVEDKPWEPAKMGDLGYVKKVAKQLGVLNILGE